MLSHPKPEDRFQWTPGKHVVRIAFVIAPTPPPGESGPILAISNPVKVQIEPAPAPALQADPLQSPRAADMRTVVLAGLEYATEHPQWPATLDELKPKYLDAGKIDPGQFVYHPPGPESLEEIHKTWWWCRRRSRPLPAAASSALPTATSSLSAIPRLARSGFSPRRPNPRPRPTRRRKKQRMARRNSVETLAQSASEGSIAEDAAISAPRLRLRASVVAHHGLRS